MEVDHVNQEDRTLSHLLRSVRTFRKVVIHVIQ